MSVDRTRVSPSALLASLALAVVAVLAPAPAAVAHDRLVSTDPVADSNVATLPEAVTLELSAEPLPGAGTEVQVTDASGATLSAGSAVVDGTRVIQPLSGDVTGAITVLWRIVSSDGHPISGEFTFVVTGEDPQTRPSSPSGDEATTQTRTASPAPAPTTTGDAPTPAPDGEQSTASPLPWIALGIVLAAAAAALVYLLLRRRAASRAEADRDR